MPAAQAQRSATIARSVRTHLRLGWYVLLLFLVLGAALEALHGLKVQWYLAATNETRRLMWTLGHAHGTLLGLINVAFAVTLPRLTEWSLPRARFASRCLSAATLAIPAGFLLGGAVLYAGDPGLGVLLVPIGAVLLFVSVFLVARASAAST